MGTLRSKVNHTGLEINGVMLGDPVAPVRVDGSPALPGDAMSDLWWLWDDPRLPTGEIIDGLITIFS